MKQRNLTIRNLFGITLTVFMFLFVPQSASADTQISTFLSDISSLSISNLSISNPFDFSDQFNSFNSSVKELVNTTADVTGEITKNVDDVKFLASEVVSNISRTAGSQIASQSALVSASVSNSVNGNLEKAYGFLIDKAANVFSLFFNNTEDESEGVMVDNENIIDDISERKIPNPARALAPASTQPTTYTLTNSQSTSNAPKNLSAPQNILSNNFIQNILKRLSTIESALQNTIASGAIVGTPINPTYPAPIYQHITNNYAGGGGSYSVPADTTASTNAIVTSAVSTSAASLQQQIDVLSTSGAATNTFAYILATSTTATSTFSGNVGIGGNLTTSGNITANTFYGDGSNLTGITSFSTSTTRSVLSSSATGLTYTNSTGDFSLTSGYNIPLTASTTEWASKISSQWTTSGSDISYSAGNIGIATTTPGSALTVAGDILSTGSLTIGTTLARTGQGTFFDGNNFTALGANAGFRSNGGNMTLGNGTDAYLVTLRQSYGLFAASTASIGFTDSTSYSGTLDTNLSRISAGVIGVGTGSTGSSAGTLLATTIGIGTTTPSAKLAITATAGTGDIFAIAASTEARLFTVKSTGKVGIGTSNPDASISIIDDNNYEGLNIKHGNLTQGLSLGWNGISKTGSAVDSSLYINAKGTGDIILQTVATGKVGIATTTPGYALTVAGDISLTGALRANGDAGTSGMVLQTTGTGAQWVATSSLGIPASQWTTSGSDVYYNTGNVGIGTTTPGSKLTVSGNAFIGGTLTATGTVSVAAVITGTVTNAPTIDFGSDMSNVLMVSGGTGGRVVGFGNMGGGHMALRVSSGAFIEWSVPNDPRQGVDTAFQRLAAGKIGLGNGTSNDISGTLVLGNLGIGSSTPASVFGVVGTSTLAGTVQLYDKGLIKLGTTNMLFGSTTTGNAFIGGAGNFTATAAGNYGFGGSALSAVAGGDSNIAMGYEAGKLISSGSRNIAIGHQTLDAMTTGGSDNTVIGYNAMTTSSGSASSNTVVGSYALNTISGSSYNVAIGVRAGYNMTSGTGNIIIGSGSSGNGIDAPSNTSSYTLNIGGLLWGTGVNQNISGSSISSGNVGIGSSTPTARLSIVGASGATTALMHVASSTGSSYFNVSAAGNVGIGTTTPAYSLSVVSSGNAQAWIGTSGSGFGYTLGRNISTGYLDILGNQSGFQGINVDAIKSTGAITVGGNAVITNWSTTLGLGGGSGTPNATLELIGSSGAQLALGGGSGSNYTFSRNSGTGYLEIAGQQGQFTGYKFSTGQYTNVFTLLDGAGSVFNESGDSTIDFRIEGDTNANLLFADASADTIGIGTSTPLYRLDIASSVASGYVTRITNTGNATGANGLIIQGGENTTGGATFADFRINNGTSVGSITQVSNTGVLYNTTSDLRAKENIVATHYGLSDLMNIKVSDYNFISDAQKRRSTGVIAQELYAIFPEAVSKPADESKSMWAVDYGRITPLIIKSVQELSDLVTALKTKVEVMFAWFGTDGDRFNVKGLVCVDDVCVTKDQFKQLLINTGGASGVSTSTPAVTAPVASTGASGVSGNSGDSGNTQNGTSTTSGDTNGDGTNGDASNGGVTGGTDTTTTSIPDETQPPNEPISNPQPESVPAQTPAPVTAPEPTPVVVESAPTPEPAPSLNSSVDTE